MAQRVLADILCEELKPSVCQMHPMVYKAVRKYSVALHAERVLWFSLQDAEVSLKSAFKQNEKEDGWPGTSLDELKQLLRRQRQLEQFMKPVSNTSVLAEFDIDMDRATLEVRKGVIDAATELLESPEVADALDQSAKNVIAATVEQIGVKPEEASEKPAVKAAQKGRIKKALLVLAGFAASAMGVVGTLTKFGGDLEKLFNLFKTLAETVARLHI